MGLWKKDRLGKLCSISIGGTPARANPVYWDTAKTGSNLWASIKDLRNRFVTETEEQITDAGVRHSNAKLVKAGTVLMSFKLTIGRVAFAGRDLYTNEAIAAFETEQADSTFLYYGLQNWNLLAGVDQAIKGATLNKAKLKEIEVYLPVLKEEQRGIADVLSTIDQAIEQTESLIDKYQRIKTGMMHDLLTRGIDEDGCLRDPVTHKFKPSALGPIPAEWEVNPLRHYLQFISYGFTNPMPETPEGPYLVTAANVIDGGIDYESCRRTAQDAFDRLLTDKSRPIKNDILLTKDGSLGRLALVGNATLCINQSVAVLRVNEKIEAHFLKLILEAPFYQNLMLADAGGSTIKHLYITRVDKMPMAIPPRSSERDAIHRVLQTQAELQRSHLNELSKLQHLRAGLMQDLLTGKVPVDPLLNFKPPTNS
jgi:type I restriction enzyme, S subunit